MTTYLSGGASGDSIAEKILYENEVLGGISRMTILLNGGVIPHRIAMQAIELLGTRVAPIVKKELASPAKSLVHLIRPFGNPLQSTDRYQQEHCIGHHQTVAVDDRSMQPWAQHPHGVKNWDSDGATPTARDHVIMQGHEHER